MSIKYGTPEGILALSDYLFGVTQQKKTKIAQMSQPFKRNLPNTGREQTSADYPVIECRDLEASAGREVRFDLVGKSRDTPFKGKENFEGKGRVLPWSKDFIKLNLTAYPIDCGSILDQQTTKHDLYTTGKNAAIDWAEAWTEQLALVQLSGARGFHNGSDWILPFQGDAQFSTLVDNTVKCPTANRHYLASGTGLAPVTATNNAIDILTTDLMTYDTVKAIVTENDEMDYPIMGCKFDGDDMGADAPVNILYVTPRQYLSLKNSTGFTTLQSQALARSRQPGQNPVFTGSIGMMENTIILKRHIPTRFYAGNEIKYCASKTAETETTGDLVPAGFGTTHAVDRALFIGSRALGKAYGGFSMKKFRQTRKMAGYMWSEEWLNHKTKLEVAIMMLMNMKKFRFDLDHGGAGIQPTDYGVACIDTAVAL